MSASQAETFERCMSVGGVAVFPSDTVYGLACDPSNRTAVQRLYRLKRRALDKPSAVMFFDRALALEAVPELGARTVAALERLLPGPVSLLLPNPAARFALACGEDPGTLGLRVVDVPALDGVRWPVLQSSANHAGGADARRLSDVPEEIRRRCEMVIDGGELPGTPSTVIDLRGYELDGGWAIIREGGMAAAEVASRLAGQFHFDPGSYEEMIRGDIPAYDEFQDIAAQAGRDRGAADPRARDGDGADRAPPARPQPRGDARRHRRERGDARRGAGTAPGRARLAARRPDAGRAARGTVRPRRHRPVRPPPRRSRQARPVRPRAGAPGPRRAVGAGGRHRAERSGRRAIDLTPGFDMPDKASDQLVWLREAGFDERLEVDHEDLAVVVAEAADAARRGRIDP